MPEKAKICSQARHQLENTSQEELHTVKDVRERLVDSEEEGRQAGNGETELDEDDVEDLENILTALGSAREENG